MSDRLESEYLTTVLTRSAAPVAHPAAAWSGFGLEGSGQALAGAIATAAAVVSAGLALAFETLLAWEERARQRHHLVGLDDRLLKDIGVTRADAWREARKPFWRL